MIKKKKELTSPANGFKGPNNQRIKKMEKVAMLMGLSLFAINMTIPRPKLAPCLSLYIYERQQQRVTPFDGVYLLVFFSSSFFLPQKNTCQKDAYE